MDISVDFEKRRSVFPLVFLIVRTTLARAGHSVILRCPLASYQGNFYGAGHIQLQ